MVTKCELIDDIIFNRMDGDTTIETCEHFVDDVEGVDEILHAEMKAVLEHAANMISRLKELCVECNLDHNVDEI